MKKALILVLLCSYLFSCDKDNDVTPPDPSASPQDTLSTGWRVVDFSQVKKESLSDIFFINNLTGFFVSDSGIYKSADGGNSWQQKYKMKELINIAMSNEQNALFVSSYRNVTKNAIVFTHDGGNNFDTTLLNDPELSDAFFTGLNNAYAVGRYFWKTTDGGISWTNLYDFGNTPGYRTLQFINENTGWIAGTSGVFKTTDGGLHWQAQNTSPDFEFPANSTGSLFFVDGSNGFIGDKTSIGKTANSGDQWNKIFQVSETYHDLHFLNTNEGYLTDFQYIYKTTNGGNNWSKEVVLPAKVFTELHFTDASHGWACGQSGLILKYER